ncbi:DUF86 domain-containing protein [Deefgea tanakiae]|uniref:DUF86 domain-containing protein n=1 Tax=Deefgea tanakiae TaxID=2865840 RepID=A0ABX8Z9Z9_9NEIS|nr:DUF86 domain-containing protein [Deefgea tanakiae]QZA79393.1 DUF86 domain-containing protein [Deefgea tanakiae]
MKSTTAKQKKALNNILTQEENLIDIAKFYRNFRACYSTILNILRAFASVQDMGQHLILREKLGVPQSAGDVFTLLATAKWIDTELATSLQKMVGFRNIAVHDYQTLLFKDQSPSV